MLFGQVLQDLKSLTVFAYSMTALFFDVEVKSLSFKIILKLQFVAANHVKSLILTNDVVSLEVLHKRAISHLQKGHLEVRSFSAAHETSGHTRGK